MAVIGGYRIIRRLGSGGRSDVYLGHGGHEPGGQPRLAAIKVFKPHVAEESIDAEISALGRLSHAHIMRMLDLATGDRGVPCLVLQRLEPGGLPRLLAERRELEPGEAVTILAPVVGAIAAMHSTGVVHGGLGARSVLFDTTGAPVIAGFGRASWFSAPTTPVTRALLDGEPRVVRDRESVTSLVLSVLGRVRSGNGEVTELLGWLRTQASSAEAWEHLEHRLFAIATPLPVDFAIGPPGHPVPYRPTADRSDSLLERPSSVEPDSAGAGWSGHWGLPPEIATWLGRQWARFPDWAVFRAVALPSTIRSVRRRVWVVAAIGAIAMTAAILLAQLPNSEQRDVSESSPQGSGASAHAAPPAEAEQDDPLAAAVALLERRERCLHERSILCLDGVHAPGSSSWLADAGRIHSVEDGGEMEPDPLASVGDITVVDLMGDTALLTVASAGAQTGENATASVLIIRTEAGWRFRSLLAGSSAVG